MLQVLGVHPHPAVVPIAPVLGDPVIEAEASLEIHAEAAPGPRRDAVPAQQGAAEHHEVPAGADHPGVRVTRDGERRGINLEQPPGDAASGPQLALRKALGRQPELVGRERMHDQPGHYSAQGHRIRGQAAQRLRADLAQVSQRAGNCVIDRLHDDDVNVPVCHWPAAGEAPKS
jgi:hypothetical protein